MTDTTPEMPLRIWARSEGVFLRLPGGVEMQHGGWTEGAEGSRGLTQYIRADAEAGMRRIEAIAESGWKAEAERDIYRRALESITKVADKHSVREMIRVVVEAHDALTQGDALRDTRDLARADGGSGQSGAGAPTTPPHKSSERTSLIDDPKMTRQAGERPAD